jgi:hypothetical protein
MTTSERRAGAASRLVLSGRARSVSFGDETLVVDLEDGRQMAVPIAWFPRLADATVEQRARWELIGRGIGIHWPDIDEDISVENLLGADGELLMYRAGELAYPATPAPPEEPNPARTENATDTRSRVERVPHHTTPAPPPPTR